jgi:hypothetical protein
VKYQLVLQWPGSTIGDYDAMISVEEYLIDGLRDDAKVDGHDAGSGQVNIFVCTSDPLKAFKDVEGILKDCGAWSDVRIAYRDLDDAEYTILWPSGSGEFEVL